MTQLALPLRPRGRMHAASLDSPRLQRVLEVLQRGGWWGTRAIIVEADVCAVNSVVAELRENGIDVQSRCVGHGRYEYRLANTGGNT